jgi:chemotaxis protein CheD
MIGERNVAFIRQFVRNEDLRVISEDMGDTYPRRLRYYPDTGRAMLMRLQRREDMQLVQQERKLAAALKSHPPEGDIELF